MNEKGLKKQVQYRCVVIAVMARLQDFFVLSADKSIYLGICVPAGG
ncbi:MAG: hypothetical protein K6B69_14880 [Lachnospiraceae bacterium]|nr:hypothetical protein [Lachnospiraceae bacterium]